VLSYGQARVTGVVLYTVQRLKKFFFRSLTVSPRRITTYDMDPDLQRSTCQAL
jgi:hypothetical protein